MGDAVTLVSLAAAIKAPYDGSECLPVSLAATQQLEGLTMETLTVTAAGDLLSAWTAVEVLSPEIFSKKEELAGGDKEAIIPMAGNTLPWGSGGNQPAKGKKLFYPVVIGALKLQEVEQQLCTQFPDPKGHVEPRSAARRAVMAEALLDHNGCQLELLPTNPTIVDIRGTTRIFIPFYFS